MFYVFKEDILLIQLSIVICVCRIVFLAQTFQAVIFVEMDISFQYQQVEKWHVVLVMLNVLTAQVVRQTAQFATSIVTLLTIIVFLVISHYHFVLLVIYQLTPLILSVHFVKLVWSFHQMEAA